MKASEEFPGGFPPEVDNWCNHPASEILHSPFAASRRRMKENMMRWEPDNSNLDPNSGPTSIDGSLFKGIWWHLSPAHYWGAIVQLYSSMSLSLETDRPIAIAGVVDTFRPFLGEYWAGAGEPHCSRLLEKRAPSWSWMSLKGQVFYNTPCKFADTDVVLCHFVEAEVLSLADIRLRLRAPLVYATRVTAGSNPILAWGLWVSGFGPRRHAGHCVSSFKGDLK
ncbi:hypothetical protein PG994_006705 [Apiospora phragmitis]|uniref:Uncharacterized protein n=1 Tax=Apiospora phragmitis TaxID=2905665 RepID=A0ABR1VFU3_9PEZI